MSEEQTPEAWSVRRVLKWATEDFQRRGNPSARLDAELLLCITLGVDRIRLITDADRPLKPAELSVYREFIKRRRTGEPIAYMLGQREFYGLCFHVDGRVLIPRPDTEILVEAALTRTRDRAMYGRALDLCTGSGCVAIAFGKHRPTWKVTAVDLSEDALEVAHYNSLRIGTAWNVNFRRGNLFEGLPASAKFELITANPPYIPSSEIPKLDADIRDFEPHLALDGGADGLDVVRTLVASAPDFLEADGVLAIEIGYDQAPRVQELFENAGFVNVERHRDYGGHERVVSGQRRP